MIGESQWMFSCPNHFTLGFGPLNLPFQMHSVFIIAFFFVYLVILFGLEHLWFNQGMERSKWQGNCNAEEQRWNKKRPSAFSEISCCFLFFLIKKMYYILYIFSSKHKSVCLFPVSKALCDLISQFSDRLMLHSGLCFNCLLLLLSDFLCHKFQKTRRCNLDKTSFTHVYSG